MAKLQKYMCKKPAYRKSPSSEIASGGRHYFCALSQQEIVFKKDKASLHVISKRYRQYRPALTVF